MALVERDGRHHPIQVYRPGAAFLQIGNRVVEQRCPDPAPARLRADDQLADEPAVNVGRGNADADRLLSLAGDQAALRIMPVEALELGLRLASPTFTSGASGRKDQIVIPHWLDGES